jgi:L-seryl-tRNA(Ser) seleniumtransferase
MLGLSAENLRGRCEAWALELTAESIHSEVVPASSVVGGGTTPGAVLPGYAVALLPQGLSADSLAALLRTMNPPVITRIHEGLVLLDLRTVPEHVDRTLDDLGNQLRVRIAASTGNPDLNLSR